MPSLEEQGDAAAREFRESDPPEHGRAWLAESPAAVDAGPGPWHYKKASRYARRAAKALDGDEVTRAQALAAIGQVHATLALAAATALGGQESGKWDEVARLDAPPPMH
jgi:hypothetical protein